LTPSPGATAQQISHQWHRTCLYHVPDVHLNNSVHNDDHVHVDGLASDGLEQLERSHATIYLLIQIDCLQYTVCAYETPPAPRHQQRRQTPGTAGCCHVEGRADGRQCCHGRQRTPRTAKLHTRFTFRLDNDDRRKASYRFS
jgi:hypothetical protein